MQVIILMSYKVINNFNEIEIIKDKTLIICDIDKTILYHDVKKEKFIDMLKDDKKIQGNVRFLLNNCYIPLSPVLRVLYNYWGYYAKEECYFLE